MHTPHYPEFEQEHQFHVSVKQLMSEVLEFVDEDNWDAIVDVLNTHALAPFLKYEQIGSHIAAQHNSVLFDLFMAHVCQSKTGAKLNRFVEAVQSDACVYDFVHALEYDTSWQENTKLCNHWMTLSIRCNRMACLRTVAKHAPNILVDTWVSAVRSSIDNLCAETFNVLMQQRPELRSNDYAAVLSLLHEEHLRPLQFIVFDHLALSDVLSYTPHYRHNTIKQLYDEHQHALNTQQHERIEQQVCSNRNSRERKL